MVDVSEGLLSNHLLQQYYCGNLEQEPWLPCQIAWDYRRRQAVDRQAAGQPQPLL